MAAALDNAADGPIEEGSVGGGTGMITFGFKAGSGTASRMVEWQGERFTVGVFVQANFGKRWNLMIGGHRSGTELAEPAIREGTPRAEKGSIIAVVATDAPLLPHQLKRLAKRVPLGVALTGGLGYHSSGDIFLAFSTANAEAARAHPDNGAGGVRARPGHRQVLRRGGAGDRGSNPQQPCRQRGHDWPRRQFRPGPAEGLAAAEVSAGIAGQGPGRRG